MILSTHKIIQQSELHCYHCGEKCTDNKEKIGDKIFCCDGCRLVFEILNENNLCSYYSFNQSAGISPEHIQFQGTFDFLNQNGVSVQILTNLVLSLRCAPYFLGENLHFGWQFGLWIRPIEAAQLLVHVRRAGHWLLFRNPFLWNHSSFPEDFC